MTRFLTLLPNVESDIALGLEQGAHYVLTGPDGRRASFNDSSDPDHVGFLTKPPSGFDSPDTRESADVIVEGDGGVHGSFYYGRRPWTLEGMIDPVPRLAGDEELGVAALVNRRVDRLKRASRALRGNATLRWTPQGGAGVELEARRQSIRITDRMPKTFLLAMVSSDIRFLSQIVNADAAAGTADLEARNQGNTSAPWTITLRNAFTNPVITNNATGQVLSLSITLVASDELVIDSRAKTITLNGDNAYDVLDFPASDWLDLVAGDNTLSVVGEGSGAAWGITWRDAWD